MAKTIRISDDAYEFLENLRWERRLRTPAELLDQILDECFEDDNGDDE